MSISIRPGEGYSISVSDDGHRLFVSDECNWGLAKPENWTIRPPRNGEPADLVIEVRRIVTTDPEDGREFCGVEGEWFQAGTHNPKEGESNV